MADLRNDRFLPFVPLLVGQGKLAKHLSYYFSKLSLPFESLPSARNIEEDLSLSGSLNRVSAIWILVSDQAIEHVKDQLTALVPKLSGRKNLPILHSSAASDIQGTFTVHPLQTFGPALYPLEIYKTIPFVFMKSNIKSEPNHAEIEEQIQFQKQLKFYLPNPQFEISNHNRALYHAYCVMMSNFPQILWSAVMKESKTLTDHGRALFSPILKQATENFLNLGEAALTGPIIRGDLHTIQNHKEALKNSPLLPLYLEFEEAFVKILKKEKP